MRARWTRHAARRCAAALFALLGPAAAALAQPAAEAPQVWKLCARGIGDDPARPFTQTLRVTLSVRGAALEPALAPRLAAQLLRERAWAGQAVRIAIEPDDDEACAAADDRTLSLEIELSADERDALAAALERGGGALRVVAALAQRAAVGIGAAGEPSQRCTLRVYYATNRRATGSTGINTAFGSERVDALSYGAVDVSVRLEAGMRELQCPAARRFDKATDLARFEPAPTLLPLPHEAWRTALRGLATSFEQPGVLLFIHGYNVPFVDAARRAAQLAYDLAFTGATVFLAWPSDASAIQYLGDGRDAENSQLAATSVLADVAELQPGGPVFVIGHSMGNRLLTAGLVRLLDERPQARFAFREIVLAAPDVDQETFRLHVAGKLLNSGPRVTLYASRHDLALQTSQFLQGGTRLGFGGPALYVQAGLDSVDASAATHEFFALNHSYFGDKTTVLADLFHLIREGLPPSQRPNLRPLAAPDGAWQLRPQAAAPVPPQ